RRRVQRLVREGRPRRGRAVGRTLRRPRARAPVDRAARAARRPRRGARRPVERPERALSNVDDAREQIAQVAVTLRAFTRAAGATGTMLLLDQGEEVPPLLVDCPALGPAVL